jgi:hypothetical protein
VKALNDKLNVVGHLLVSRALLTSSNVWEGRREELNIERVFKEHFHIIDELLHAHICINLVSYIDNKLDNYKND